MGADNWQTLHVIGRDRLISDFSKTFIPQYDQLYVKEHINHEYRPYSCLGQAQQPG